MKARFLKIGQPVKVNGRMMTFVARYKDGAPKNRNVFHCEDYQGFDGSKDKGLTVMSDHYFATFSQCPTALEIREALKKVPALLEELNK